MAIGNGRKRPTLVAKDDGVAIKCGIDTRPVALDPRPVGYFM